MLAEALLSFGLGYQPDPSDRLQQIAENRDRFVATSMLFIASQMLLLPAVLGIVHVIGGRGIVLAHVGGILAVLGILGHLVFSGSAPVQTLMADASADEAIISLAERMAESPLLLAFAALGVFATILGLIPLAVAMWRSRLTPIWIPGLIALALVVEFLGSPLVGDWAFVVARLLLLLALGWLGTRILRMTDREWQQSASVDRGGVAR